MAESKFDYQIDPTWIKFEDVKDEAAETYFAGNTLSMRSYESKYRLKESGETTPAQTLWRVASYIAQPEKDNSEAAFEYWRRRWFHEMYTGDWMAGGSIIQGAGHPGKISMSNCTTLGFGSEGKSGDNLEAIFDTAYTVAKVAAYRQGLGVDFGLRPEGMKVHNSSKVSQGNTHWMRWINTIGLFIGQLGRIPAMLFSTHCANPDLARFITIKNNHKEIENANISVHYTDAFMDTLDRVIKGELPQDTVWKMAYEADTGERMESQRSILELFDMFVENNWRWAEPGAQFIDTAKRWSNSDYLRDERWKVRSTNACVAAGTIIPTRSGPQPIETLVGKEIETWNGTGWTKVTVRLTAKEDNIWLVTLRDGRKLRCNRSHRWEMASGFDAETAELQPGDRLKQYPRANGELQEAGIITSVKDTGLVEPVYCFNDPKTGRGTFNDITTFQCSEQYLEFWGRDISAGLCVLASANYYKLPNDIKEAAAVLRYRIAPSMNRFLDNVVEMEIRDKRYPLKGQLNSLKALRRTGAGITNLDGWLIRNGIGYDTDEGIDAICYLTDQYNLGLYETSIALGEEKGNFEAFVREYYIESPFIRQMMERFPHLKFRTMRNVCVGSIAPTGTLSNWFATRFSKFISYGMEPVMGFYYWKRDRTTGTYKWSFHVPSFVRDILAEKGIDLGMKSDSIDENPEGTLGEAYARIIDKHFPKDKFKPAHEIDPFKKVRLMGRLTKESVDSSISITYNLREDVSKETIRDIYIYAWKQGVKSVAIYRDKSREGIVEFEPPYVVMKRYSAEAATQPETQSASTLAGMPSNRPEIMQADVHHLSVHGDKWIAFVGLYEGRPYEVFAGKQSAITLPKKYNNGAITRGKKGSYMFESGQGDDAITVDISKSFTNDEHSALTRQISLALRFGVPLSRILDQLDKSHGTIVDFSKVIARTLKSYITVEDLKDTYKCRECGSSDFTMVEKCPVCNACGSSKCS